MDNLGIVFFFEYFNIRLRCFGRNGGRNVMEKVFFCVRFIFFFENMNII